MDKRNCIYEKRCFDYFFKQLIYRYLGGTAKVGKGEGVSYVYKLAVILRRHSNLTDKALTNWIA